MSNLPDWKDLLPEGLRHLPHKEQQVGFLRMMGELPKGSPLRIAIKTFLNAQYGTMVVTKEKEKID